MAHCYPFHFPSSPPVPMRAAPKLPSPGAGCGGGLGEEVRGLVEVVVRLRALRVQALHARGRADPPRSQRCARRDSWVPVEMHASRGLKLPPPALCPRRRGSRLPVEARVVGRQPARPPREGPGEAREVQRLPGRERRVARKLRGVRELQDLTGGRTPVETLQTFETPHDAHMRR